MTNGEDVYNSANKHLGKIVWHGCQGEYVFVPAKEAMYYYIHHLSEILCVMRMLQAERLKMIEVVGT